jgi:ketosteroid isomerase-like protein
MPLLGSSGAGDVERDVRGVVLQFQEALNRRDAETMQRLLTPDTLFENTYPPPDGSRHAGREAVMAFWLDFFGASKEVNFEAEEIFAAGERCVLLWVYHWVGKDGMPGHVRGVDIFRLRDGLIAEKLSYVKG